MSRTLYPLAVDLRGKPVLVVGGGAVAARKLAELLRCGADITVLAPEPAPPVERLESALRLVRRPFKSGDELGRYLVFACTDDSVVNHEIAALCLRGNILCNVADASSEGSFHVPGVVRKGDVTVTVSTGGAAPGLTRHLKRLLSETLGEETAELAALLGRFRSELRAGAPAGEAAEILEALPYRKLLEDLKSRGAPAVERYLAEVRLRREAPGPSAAGPGPVDPVVPPVALVGAGPGHPGLLTLMAAEALRRAEVIVHDRLVPEETLRLASPDCLLIAAGKRGHFESARQEDIQDKLIEHAKRGKRVVRLKGGDPFVYGRGWEEVLALEAAGIPWTAIPGVSSTTAGPAWAGIPLTHRGLARSYAVMSGMSYSRTNTEIPKADTIVLVMGLHRLAEIVPAFLAQGWSADTPAAAIQGATLPDQRLCLSTLAEIRAETVRLGFDSPTLLVIGEVVGLAGKSPQRTAGPRN
ncbi:MAG TPA: uroporphyrinogen-III C-methyltransferase [Fibrobacteria bacterium]|nr:uroporphyrinogen-III C-methyltransferase [Fibrobacteria bacterium]